MSETAKYKVESNPKHEDLWLACGTCKGKTCHKILTFVEKHDESPDGGIEIWVEFMTVQCQGCKEVSFCESSTCTEDYETDPVTGDQTLATTTKVYPPRLAERQLLDDAGELPHTVYRVYREVHSALCSNQQVLAGIGIRALIETVCKEKAATGKDLQSKIDNLVTKGIVTTDGAKVLHSLRFMGNAAAHEVKAHTGDELAVAFEVAENLLFNTYILAKKAAKLPAPPVKLPIPPVKGVKALSKPLPGSIAKAPVTKK